MVIVGGASVRILGGMLCVSIKSGVKCTYGWEEWNFKAVIMFTLSVKILSSLQDKCDVYCGGN